MLTTFVRTDGDLVAMSSTGNISDPENRARHKAELAKYLEENKGATVVSSEPNHPVVLLDPNAAPELTENIESRLKGAAVNVDKVNNSGINGAFMSKDKVKGNKLALQYKRSLNKLKQQLQSPKPVSLEIEDWSYCR